MAIVRLSSRRSRTERGIGVMFGMGRSRANGWIHRLNGVARRVPDEPGMLPERDPGRLTEVLAEGGARRSSLTGIL